MSSRVNKQKRLIKETFKEFKLINKSVYVLIKISSFFSKSWIFVLLMEWNAFLHYQIFYFESKFHKLENKLYIYFPAWNIQFYLLLNQDS